MLQLVKQAFRWFSANVGVGLQSQSFRRDVSCVPFLCLETEMLEILAALAWGAMELALALSGKWFVRVISLGRWRGESLRGSEGRMYGPAGALSFTRDGQRVFTWNGMQLAGLVFYVLLCVTALVVTSLI
jgi:hypothetical protein